MWRHVLVSGGGARGELRMNPWTSKPRLGFRDVDLDAVCPLCGRVLSERSCSFGSHEASAGFLSLAVLKVQRAFPHHTATPLGWPFWQRGWPLPLLRTQNDITTGSWFTVAFLICTKQDNSPITDIYYGILCWDMEVNCAKKTEKTSDYKLKKNMKMFTFYLVCLLYVIALWKNTKGFLIELRARTCNWELWGKGR